MKADRSPELAPVARAGVYGPVFIVGAARSGTTLLKTMLDRHPDVAIPPESHFIPYLWARRRRYGSQGRIYHQQRLLRDLASTRFRHWGLSIDAVRDEMASTVSERFPDAVEAIYLAYAHSRGKGRWGDKTPRYVARMELLADLFPHARFVHIVRDGRDVALSVLDLRKLHTHAATAAFFWRRRVKQGRNAARMLAPGRYLEVHYEDLIDDPASSMRIICTFLHLPFHPVLLQRDDDALSRIPGHHHGMHSRIALPPTRGLRDWRSQMADSEVAEFEAIAGRELSTMGYELSGVRPPQLAKVRAWIRMAGLGLRYVRRRWRRISGPAHRANTA
jgi:hypothetical protein